MHLVLLYYNESIMKYRSGKYCIFFLCAMLLFASCRVNKNIAYFKDVPDSLYLSSRDVATVPFTDPVIKPNDILQVSILTLDPVVNAMLNTESTTSFTVQPGSANAQATSPQVNGFLVDRDGNLELPIVGKVKVAGLTTSVARDSIHNRVELYYKKPVVNVKFTNFTVTVLGEVAHPSTYVVPNEKVSILDAIGMAGDLTIFGKRENVMLIRDTLGQKQFIRFNLNSSSTISSPYFYLRQGDVVYVEPGKARVEGTDAAVKARNYSLIISLTALIITIISRI